MDRVFLLRCAVKTYDWGKLGFDSSVAQLYKSAFDDFEVKQSTPYAELWMGTHPSGPSVIPSLNNMNLMDWTVKHPEMLGSKMLEKFKEPGLPFLFKVLSVRKSLSIQAHPDKKTAVQLHHMFPDVYPDDNHKPEMAIALTEFRAFCGFRPSAEIKALVMELPQLQALIGSEISALILNSKNFDQKLMKQFFYTFSTRKEEEYQPLLFDLVKFMENNASFSDLCKSIKDIFLKIYKEYPGDIGCFCAFFLNYLVLKPGDAIFLAANEPHAYLEGDCIECMACSDNVVRAGLTPKFRDVKTFCDILTYNCKSASETFFQSIDHNEDPYVKIYDPPVDEFVVDKIEVPPSNTSYNLRALDNASLLIMIEGEANSLATSGNIKLHKGSVLFIACQTEVELHIISKVLLFRAYCNA